MSPKSELSLQDFHASNFRCFDDLKVSDLGRVNLIVGRNSVGKSTLLEALHVFGSRSRIDALEGIAVRRGEAWRSTTQHAEGMLSMFKSEPAPGSTILLGPPGNELQVRVVELVRRTQPEGFWRYEPVQATLFSPDNSIPAQGAVWGLEIRQGDVLLQRAVIDSTYRLRPRMLGREETDAVVSVESVLVNSGGLSAPHLANLWDNIALSEQEDLVVSLVRSVFPTIQRISMVGRSSETEARSERRAFVRTDDFPHPVPIQRLGDGVSRILGIAIALVNAQGGLLLIDEFENGLHYSIHDQVWDFVFDACERMNVQAFLATHSLDCVRAFSRAASRSSARGSLIRLERRSGKISAVQVDEETLEIAERNEVELR